MNFLHHGKRREPVCQKTAVRVEVDGDDPQEKIILAEDGMYLKDFRILLNCRPEDFPGLRAMFVQLDLGKGLHAQSKLCAIQNGNSSNDYPVFFQSFDAPPRLRLRQANALAQLAHGKRCIHLQRCKDFSIELVNMHNLF